MVYGIARRVKTRNVFSVVFGAIASLLGLLYIILSVLIMFSQTSIVDEATAVMYFLYGSLASYFGLKDLISTVQTMKHKRWM